MANTVLITGCAGFIGSHLVDTFLNAKCYVIGLDNFDDYYDPTLKRKNIEPSLDNTNFKLIEGDIRDKKLVNWILTEHGIGYIFHQAARPGVRASIKDPFKAHDVNTLGTLNLLECARSSKVKKLIYASSSSVYGKSEYLPFDEKHPNNPISPYGVSKLAAENYCRIYSELYGIATTALRYFTVYGPRMRPDLAVSIFSRNALSNKQLEIFGTGKKTRDFTYISDVVEANLRSMTKGDKRILNIGSGRRVSILDLAKLILKITTSNSKIVFSENVKGDTQDTLANIELANDVLAWKPRISLETGLKMYIDWLKAEW